MGQADLFSRSSNALRVWLVRPRKRDTDARASSQFRRTDPNVSLSDGSRNSWARYGCLFSSAYGRQGAAEWTREIALEPGDDPRGSCRDAAVRGRIHVPASRTFPPGDIRGLSIIFPPSDIPRAGAMSSAIRSAMPWRWANCRRTLLQKALHLMVQQECFASATHRRATSTFRAREAVCRLTKSRSTPRISLLEPFLTDSIPRPWSLGPPMSGKSAFHWTNFQLSTWS